MQIIIKASQTHKEIGLKSMELYSVCYLSIFFFCLCLLYQPSNCQQTYLDNDQLDCTRESSLAKGYVCYGSGPQTSCQSFLTFRSKPPYDSPLSIAFLLGSDASSIAMINNIPSGDEKIPSEKLVKVPISCSCNGSIYQHNTAYTIQRGETYYLISNNTYQGLTTCQALFDQNNYNVTNIPVGAVVTVPVRCACPSEIQTANGVSFLLSYMIASGDSLTSIANEFGVNEASIVDANMLPQASIIYPSTPLLIPLKSDSCITNPENFFCNCHINGSSSVGNHCKPDGKSFPVKLVIILGTSIGLGIVFVCLSGYMLFQYLKNKRNKMQKEKLFKQNGGFLLQQKLSSHGSVEKTKIYTAEELRSATDNFNESRFLGQGGFGTVYKGMLPNGSVVGVKRTKAIDKSQIEQFINEVVVLSQINHRNIVKLLGCCLETEVPVLVYEFIPNGTLFHHIHNHPKKEQESSLSWEHRLRIACEVAGAVAYMHSAASIPIFHRDIESSNILLDDKYNAKVSDFGTSRSIPNDKTHLTTAVQGTFGYLDPEYFQSSQFTDKSDVYSFGVVLVELLTGKKPISFARVEEERNLVAYFISLAKKNQLMQILDTQVAKEASREDIQAVAELAMRCLRLNGKKRPTMKQVALELEGLRRSQNCLELDQEPDQLLRDEISYVGIAEENRAQVSTEESLVFSLQMESNSF